MTIRDSAVVRELPIERLRSEPLDLPVPDHLLFRDKEYRYPFVRRLPFATVMTDFGCPYRCSFCVMPTLGWRLRSVDSVMKEFELLDSIGVRELLFMDQTFGIPRKRAIDLLTRMSGFPCRFGWVCFSRPDVLDPDLLNHMKRAGCHTVILGLESGSQHILDEARKDYRKEQVQTGFQLCRKYRLRTVATVILGLPEETEETFQETMRFIKKIDPDFVSFNVAVPRMGTPLRQKALKLGLITHGLEMMDQSGTEVAMPSLTLNREKIAAIRKLAVRRFYFRFSYCRGRLAQWTVSGAGWSDLAAQVRQGYGLFRNYLSAGDTSGANPEPMSRAASKQRFVEK